MIKEWVWVAFHLKSAPGLYEWLQMPNRDRRLIAEALAERIEEHNGQFED